MKSCGVKINRSNDEQKDNYSYYKYIEKRKGICLKKKKFKRDGGDEFITYLNLYS